MPLETPDLRHVFDSSMSCDYCGAAENESTRNMQCPRRLEQHKEKQAAAATPTLASLNQAKAFIATQSISPRPSLWPLAGDDSWDNLLALEFDRAFNEGVQSERMLYRLHGIIGKPAEEAVHLLRDSAADDGSTKTAFCGLRKRFGYPGKLSEDPMQVTCTTCLHAAAEELRR